MKLSSKINVNDTSDVDFRIKGALLVTAPNGNDLWFVGENQKINWTATGTVNPVKIEVSNGSGWETINASVIGIEGTNSYNWTVFSNASESCLIRVSDARGGFSDVNDTSNNTFYIRPQINVTEPQTGANVPAYVANTTAIRWTATGTTVDTVNIEYSANNGQNWTTFATNVNVNNGSNYLWPLTPSSKTTDGFIRVSDSDNPNVNGSSGKFNIIGNILLNSPNGGQLWSVVSTHPITWTSTAVDFVNVSFSVNNGSSWIPLNSTVPAGYNNVTWTISNSTQVTDRAVIKLEDADNPAVVFDTSNATFNITPVFDITAPESGAPVVAEEPYNINWTTNGSNIGNVILQYSTDDGSTWKYIIPDGDHSVSSTPPFYWSSANGSILSSQCQMRITYLNNSQVNNTGSSWFYIRGNITVTRPDDPSGLTWKIGTIEDITWTQKGNITKVDIKYSNDSGGNWSTIESAFPVPSNHTYQWNITNAYQPSYQQGLIKILDNTPGVGNVNDTSDNAFTLQGKLTLNSPTNQSTVYTYDASLTNTTITWSKLGNIKKVMLRYSTNNGTSYPNTIQRNDTNSSYVWTIPDAIGTGLKVNVTDEANSNVFNESNYSFAIKGSIQVISPNTNVSWTRG